MRNFFALLTIGLIVVGFLNPLAWVGAVITAILALGSAPSGKRADGKPKTSGLLGGVIDNIVIASKMVDCPYCKANIMKNTSKCQYCGEWVTGQGQRFQRRDGNEVIRIKGFMNLRMIDLTTAQDSRTRETYTGRITYNKDTDEWLIERDSRQNQKAL